MFRCLTEIEVTIHRIVECEAGKIDQRGVGREVVELLLINQVMWIFYLCFCRYAKLMASHATRIIHLFRKDTYINCISIC